MKTNIIFLGFCLVVAFSSFANAQIEKNSDRLSADQSVAAALERIESMEPETIEEQIKITQIPAPTFEEKIRGEYLALRFRELGLEGVRTDSVGNVIAERPGIDPKAPTLVLAAHLDTVFPIETELKTIRDGTKIKIPGIGDDGRGLAVILAIARTMQESKIRTKGTVIFVANVGEEGQGDLRGVKNLFNKELKGRITHFVSIDGSDLDVVTGAVGSKRYRVHYSGPGGHSYGAFGMANPIHALGRFIEKVSRFQTPSDPKTTFNVGIIRGGTSVNSIAFEASADVDLRSVDSYELEKLDRLMKLQAEEALKDENARWKNRGKIELRIEKIGDRPTGAQSQEHPFIKLVSSINSSINIKDDFGISSTDANLPISLGIPAIAIGGGGIGRGAHSLSEEFDSKDSALGSKRALLIVFGVVGIEN